MICLSRLFKRRSELPSSEIHLIIIYIFLFSKKRFERKKRKRENLIEEIDSLWREREREREREKEWVRMETHDVLIEVVPPPDRTEASGKVTEGGRGGGGGGGEEAVGRCYPPVVAFPISLWCRRRRRQQQKTKIDFHEKLPTKRDISRWKRCRDFVIATDADPDGATNESAETVSSETTESSPAGMMFALLRDHFN